MGPTLVIMAAGMGSRFKGHKQLEGVGPSNELLMDYSIYDAHRAGFDKVVLVVRNSFLPNVKEAMSQRWADKVNIEYVCQELTDLPEPYRLPDGREKPWGTGHAMLCCEKVISGPFAIMNADDFYGFDAFRVMGEYLSMMGEYLPRYLPRQTLGWKQRSEQAGPAQVVRGAMVGYELRRTLSRHGSVTRGLCKVDPGTDTLLSVDEISDIYLQDGRVFYKTSGAGETATASLQGSELVSMNIWGFSNEVFPTLRRLFGEFLARNINSPKSEFLIPRIMNDLLRTRDATIKVLRAEAQWFGMTYLQDKATTVESIAHLVSSGVYPPRLGA